MVSPLDFLDILRNSDKYIELIFSRGSCYQLGKLLCAVYPQAVLYKVKVNEYYDHVIVEIDGKFYDISGEASQSDISNAELVEEEDKVWLDEWGFSKRRWLTKTCEHCGEQVGIPNQFDIIETTRSSNR